MAGEVCCPGGPSPRAWGKPLSCGIGPMDRRTIPTGVGKTSRAGAMTGQPPDHPHGRGENLLSWHARLNPAGPSPRAWGKPQRDGAAIINTRTIPTGVGKTQGWSIRGGGLSDHPHGRGENASPDSRMLRNSGPSPRAWGKLDIPMSALLAWRTIPTGVGKTTSTFGRRDSSADHPHGRGENPSGSLFKYWTCGPSPRAWGKRHNVGKRSVFVRTIPTGVGKTSVFTVSQTMRADHPHGRGENLTGSTGLPGCAGPSPRAWGKQYKHAITPRRLRTIPTGVGKTGQGNGQDRFHTDHPHGRGENNFNASS